ncbi:c-type cytochrome [Mesorhizobium sp. ORM8.1]
MLTLLLFVGIRPLWASDVGRGEYLARAADCIGCHTSEPSRPLAGGYRVPTPFGEIYSTNITPDPDTGIGLYSDDEFVRALTEGIRRDGADLYPAMPYDSFAHMNRTDVLAIKAYLFAQPPIAQPRPRITLPFPFSQRPLLKFWKIANLRGGAFIADRSRSDQWNRGTYLVEVLGHCGACHTPRNLTLGMDASKKLAGGSAGIWQAFNITSDRTAGIGGWSDDELFRFLRTGDQPGKGIAGGPMAETVTNSLSHLQDEDIRAIVAYLRDVPAQPGDETEPRFHWSGIASPATALDGQEPLQGETNSEAAGLYASLCAGCHGRDGKGSADGIYPSLVNNTTTGAGSSENVIMTILYGVQAGDVAGRRSMAAFGNWLDDAEVTNLANYVFTRFGNSQVRVAAADVHQMRAGAQTSETLMVLSTQAFFLACAGCLVVLAWLLIWRRIRRIFPPHVRA